MENIAYASVAARLNGLRFIFIRCEMNRKSAFVSRPARRGGVRRIVGILRELWTGEQSTPYHFNSTKHTARAYHFRKFYNISDFEQSFVLLSRRPM